MTLLEKINAMKMPFAELKGITFTEADKDRVVARMLVRPDLCTLHHTIHGGAVMAFADSVGAAATVINLPEDAKGTTTIESKTNFIGGAKEGMTVIATATPVHRGRRTQCLACRLTDPPGQLRPGRCQLALCHSDAVLELRDRRSGGKDIGLRAATGSVR